MSNPADEIQQRISLARRAAVSGIHPSLKPLIFRDLAADGEPPLRIFSVQYLPTTASAIFKLSGLLVQAYWYLLKTNGHNSEIPRHVDNLLLQIWAGNQRYNQGTAISLLHEASVVGQPHGFRNLVKNPGVFVEWRNVLLQREGRYKGMLSALSGRDWHANLVHLIDSLPILLDVEFSDDQFIFPANECSGALAVPSSFLVHTSDRIKNPLFFHAFENVNAQPEVVFEDPYSTYTEEFVIDGSFRAAEFKMMRQLLGLKSVGKGILQLFGSSYDHIKELALAIANTPDDALDCLVKKYSKDDEYQEVDPNRNTEDFVTLLIAGEGPTEILKGLFRENPRLFDSYLSYLEPRTSGSVSGWKKELRHRLDEMSEPVERFLSLNPAMKNRILNEFKLEARCWCVIRAAGLEIAAPSGYVESLGVRIKMLRSFEKDYSLGQLDNVSAGIKLAQIVERTLRFLICFYSGMNAYYRANKLKPSDYYQCEEAMVAASNRKFKGLKKAPPGTLIREFRSLCGNAEIKELVENMLGRIYLCDLGKFDQILGMKDNKDEWTDALNSLKHGIPISQDEMIKFIETTRNLFRFLRDGKLLSRTEALFGGEPVYPYVISFSEQHRKRDGLIIYDYSLRSLDGDDVEGSIKILTPNEYAPNENYYCIPYSKKSTARWLLDPFLVRCSKLDAVLMQNA